MKKTLLLGAIAMVGVAQAQVLVNTGFETNTLGAINGQASGGPWPWEGSGTVVNTGATMGTQALTDSVANQASGGLTFTDWTQVQAVQNTGGVTIPAGQYFNGSVQVFLDPTDLNSAMGISCWSNGGNNTQGYILLSGSGSIIYRNGIGTPAGTIVANAGPTTGWHQVGVSVQQLDPNTVQSTYYIDGVLLAGISHTRTIATGNLPNEFDLVIGNVSGAAATTSGRWDNYRVAIEATPVPEPATMAALGLGALALIRRRRNKA